VKSGRTAAGSRAAQSHTAALAGSDRAVDALFRQAGVIRADTLEELLDAATVLTNQPLPAGHRVAIVTNAGGPGILCADACESRGLALPALTPETLAELLTILPPTAGLSNPVDMIASAGPAQYQATVRAVLCDANVDALIVIYTPAGMAPAADVAAAIRRGVTASGQDGQKPVLACVISGQPPPAPLGDDSGDRPIPTFRFPEAAARALTYVVRYAQWRARPPGAVPELERFDADAARAVAAAALAEFGEGWMRPDAAARLLAAAGVLLPAFEFVATPEAAVQAAGRIGFPVAVKVVSPRLTHKSDVGGVALNVSTPEAVRDACERMQGLARPDVPIDGFLVQRMAAQGTEVIIGVVDDATFGPLLGFGLGGTTVEVLNDIAFRITPLTDSDAAEMVRAIRAWPLLDGYRGRPPADVAAIEDLLLRISRLVEEVPQIAEMDLNPVMAYPAGQGIAVVDVRVALHAR
jgi:acyl-CoA synthetase (NDP forming)